MTCVSNSRQLSSDNCHLAFDPGFGRPGSDLLFHTLRCSTIGAEGFHGRVRDGIGCLPLAITTRPAKPGIVIGCDLWIVLT